MQFRNPFFSAAAAGLTVASVSCSSSAPPPSPAAAASVKRAETPAPAPVTPAMLAGNWLFEMKVGGRSVEGSLHFAVTSAVLVGTFTRSDGNEQELKNIEIQGNEVAWDLEGTGGKQHARGKVDGSSMKGTLKRSGGGRGGRGRPDGESGESGESDGPRDGGGAPPGGGRRGGRGGGGRRGGSGTSEITWSAYKSVPPVETAVPAAAPTPGA